MKHAYLIMAHNEPYVLEKLLKLLDDMRNDIYLHIDKKWKDFDQKYFQKLVNKSNLYFTDRIDVRWGTYSQVECELLLFKSASKQKYAYYHLISGVDLPLTNQDEIHSFFNKNTNLEYISFDFHDKIKEDSLNRIKYYHFFGKNKRNQNKIIRNGSNFFYQINLKLQKILKINRLKNNELIIRKGANWVSITDDLVKYLLSKEKEIKKTFNHSLCADELFLQTIVYNSDFYKRIVSKKNDDYQSIKRYIDWKRGEPYTFRKEDFDELIKSNCFFARKFSSKIDKEIIDKIYNYVRNDKNA